MAASARLVQRDDLDELKMASVREMNRQVLGLYPASVLGVVALTATFWNRAEHGPLLWWMAICALTSTVAGVAMRLSLDVSAERFWRVHRLRLLFVQFPYAVSWGWLVLGPLSGDVDDTTRYAGIVVLAAVMGLVSANGDLVGFLVMQLPVATAVALTCHQLGDHGLMGVTVFYVAITTTANTQRMYMIWERQALLADNAAMVEELEAGHARLDREASTDPLTGLDNRRQFRRTVEHLREEVGLVGVLMLDLDHFKEVNDGSGHATGDALLVEVAARLRSTVRPTDDVARLGGDEFAVVLDHLSDPEEAETIGRRLVATLSEPYELATGTHRVSASAGLAIGRGHQLFELMEKADASVYRAKDAGRGRLVMATP